MSTPRALSAVYTAPQMTGYRGHNARAIRRSNAIVRHGNRLALTTPHPAPARLPYPVPARVSIY